MNCDNFLFRKAAIVIGQCSKSSCGERCSRDVMLPFSFFKSRPKNPHEVVRAFRDAHAKLLHGGGKSLEKSSEECSRCLGLMRQMVGCDSSKSARCFFIAKESDGKDECHAELLAQLSQEAYSAGLLEILVNNLSSYDFEARKDAVTVFNALVRRQIGARNPTVEYLTTHPAILSALMRGYGHQDLALNYGLMLRECLRHESLAQLCLESEEFYSLFDYVQLPTFDIASDAFASLKDLLRKHKMLVASFLVAHYEEFFLRFNNLLGSENYVTRRQSLKLLGEILLDQCNFEVMTKYITNAEHLKLLMNLLRDSSRNIQYEAFHVFKVHLKDPKLLMLDYRKIFVANPNKNKPVYDILLKNQKKLIDFLDTFQPAKDDEQFEEEKQFLKQHIQDLSPQRRDPHLELS